MGEGKRRVQKKWGVESDVGRVMADGGGAVQVAFARLGCGRDVEVRLKDIIDT